MDASKPADFRLPRKRPSFHWEIYDGLDELGLKDDPPRQLPNDV